MLRIGRFSREVRLLRERFADFEKKLDDCMIKPINPNEGKVFQWCDPKNLLKWGAQERYNLDSILAENRMSRNSERRIGWSKYYTPPEYRNS